MLNAQDATLSFETRRSSGSEDHPKAAATANADPAYALQVLTDRIEQLEFAIGHVSETFADEAVVISSFDSRLAAIEKALEAGAGTSAENASLAARMDALNRDVVALRAEIATGISRLDARPVAPDPLPALSDVVAKMGDALRDKLDSLPDGAAVAAAIAPLGEDLARLQAGLGDLLAAQNAQNDTVSEKLGALVEEQASRGYTVAETLAALQRGLESLPEPPDTQDIVETLDARLKQRLLDPLATLSQGQTASQDAVGDLIRRIDVYRQELVDSSGKDATPMARLMAAIHNWQTRQHAINERLSARLDALAQSGPQAASGDDLVVKIDRLCQLLEAKGNVPEAPADATGAPTPAPQMEAGPDPVADPTLDTSLETGVGEALEIPDPAQPPEPEDMGPLELPETAGAETSTDDPADLAGLDEGPPADPATIEAPEIALPDMADPVGASLDLPGLDPSLLEQLTSLGIHTLEDLANADAASLNGALGDLEQLVDLAYLIEQAQAQMTPPPASRDMSEMGDVGDAGGIEELPELPPLPALDPAENA